jgi:hypothetical protein
MNPSKSAKAAAILVFTNGVVGYETAVKLFDEMSDSAEPLDAIIDKYPEVRRWSEVEHLGEMEWWNEVECLASTIDATRKHFGE